MLIVNQRWVFRDQARRKPEHLIVELKAVAALSPIHDAQLGAYLKALKLPLGLLLNFNVILLKNGIKRIIKSDY